MDELPDALEEALARVIVAERKEWTREREVMQAELRSIVASHHLEVANLKIANEMLRIEIRNLNDTFQGELKSEVKSELDNIRAAMSLVRDGKDGINGEKGERGDKGDSGEVDIDLLENLIVEHVSASRDMILATIPPPEKGEKGDTGEKGEDGKDAVLDFDYVHRAIADNVHMRLPELKGDKGADGKDGKDAVLDVDYLNAVVGSAVADKMALLPVPEVDVKLVETIVDEKVGIAFATLPPPEKGETGEKGRGVVRLALDGDTGELSAEYSDGVLERIGFAKGQKGDAGEKGETGEAGKDGEKGERGEKGLDAEVDYDLVSQIVLSQIPVPQNGKDGVDGKDVDPEQVKALVQTEVDAAFSAIPAPRDGKDVDPELVAEIVLAKISVPKDGKDGRDGVDGKDGIDGRGISELKRVGDDLILVLTDGMEFKFGRIVGERGEKGEQGVIGPRGEKGECGSDGLGLAGAFIDRANRLVVTFTDGSVHELDKVVGKDGRDGKDGEPGRDGKDGITFEDFDIDFEYDGLRTCALKIMSKGKTLEWPFKFPGMMIYREIYKSDVQYETGDTVSHGGSIWVATKSTTDKPGEGSSDWRLGCKRGRDGRDGTKGEKGDKGEKGAPGQDLTRLR